MAMCVVATECLKTGTHVPMCLGLPLQALASEREFVVALFGDEPGRNSEDGESSMGGGQHLSLQDALLMRMY